MRSALLLAALVLVGCGDSEKKKGSPFVEGSVTHSEMTGIYDVTGYTKNIEGCEVEGDESAAKYGFAVFNVYKSEIAGMTHQYAGFIDCENLANCKELDKSYGNLVAPFPDGDFYVSLYEGSDTQGYSRDVFSSGRLVEGDLCQTARKFEYKLSFDNNEKTFKIEKRTYILEDHNKENELGCSTGDAKKATVKKCASLEVLRGKFKENL